MINKFIKNFVIFVLPIILLGLSLLFIVNKHIVFAQTTDSNDDTQIININRNGVQFSTKILKEEKDLKGNREARAGSILVKFKSDVTESEENKINNSIGAEEVEKTYLAKTRRIKVKNGNTAAALKAYQNNPDVEYATVDQILRIATTPNDPRFTDQWGLTKVNAPAAWDFSTSSQSTRIAILDCGIFDSASSFIGPDGKKGHPDIRDKVISRINFTTSSNTDDFCNHGTHVAGIAAANTNNGIGGAGLGYNAKIVNVKVLGDNGSGSFTWIINGILWAAGCDTSPCGSPRAEIINMSLGATAPCDPLLQDAINKAWNQGLVIIAAGGNSNASGAITPANCNNVIGVGASDSNDNKASFSNYGSGVDVAAPGVNILSTNYTGTYSYFSGTSMASPFVAGEAALIWNTIYNTGNSSVVNRIIQTAKSSALAGSLFGRIDAFAAVVTNVITPSPTPNPTPTPTPSETPTPSPLPSLTPSPSPSPTPSPTSIPSPTPTPIPSGSVCTAPKIISTSDTDPAFGGIVSFSWNSVVGASTYQIQRQLAGNIWSTIATTSSTTFTGGDFALDSNWKVFVQSGTCTPLPGPATTFNP